jgi:hypothetical protein
MEDSPLPSASLEPARAVKFWSPKFIALATLLTGFPGGMMLAIFNWFRLGRRGMAVLHLALLGLASLGIALFSLAGSNGQIGSTPGSSLIVNLLALFYLYQIMKNEETQARQAGLQIVPGGFWQGLGAALLGFLCFFGVAMVVILVWAFIETFIPALLDGPAPLPGLEGLEG